MRLLDTVVDGNEMPLLGLGLLVLTFFGYRLGRRFGCLGMLAAMAVCFWLMGSAGMTVMWAVGTWCVIGPATVGIVVRWIRRRQTSSRGFR